MNRRYITIKNFKNIGITNNNETECINLNNTLDKYKMGELIII